MAGEDWEGMTQPFGGMKQMGSSENQPDLVLRQILTSLAIEVRVNPKTARWPAVGECPTDETNRISGCTKGHEHHPSNRSFSLRRTSDVGSVSDVR